MKRSDYKYVYNTLPKFSNLPFEKVVYRFQKNDIENNKEQYKKLWEKINQAICMERPIICTMYSIKPYSDGKSKEYIIRPLSIVTQTSNVLELGFSNPSGGYYSFKDSTNDTCTVTCVIF